MDRVLRYGYFHPNSPAAFSGVNELYKFVKSRHSGITIKQVKQWLEKQNVYTLHKPIHRKIRRNRVLAVGLDSDWQADLCDMKAVATHNRGIKYLLTVIDVLSKFAWVAPLKNKTASEVAKGFESIISSSGHRKPWRLFTDRGKEFLGKPFQQYLEHMDIQHLVAHNTDVKASVVERYNRTLKTRLWRFFTQQQTFTYLSVLPKIVKAINHSYHRSIKMRPVDVGLGNQSRVWETLYGEPKTKTATPHFRFQPGDRVRISKAKHVFEKGYLPNFTQEVFVVAKRLPHQPPVYELVDLNQEKIIGKFYENEMVPFQGKLPQPKNKKPKRKKRRKT